MDKKHFFLKLNPPRASFAMDMTEEERAIMQKHVAYWKPYVENETMLVLGPVLDTKGVYGIGIVAVESENELNALLAADPANGLHHYEVHPMRAVYKQK